jgi:CheY-like chemotaxis protein/transcriptional regulator with XRE-family HTH domain
MLTNEQYLGYLHRALNHLYEPDRLRQNPLAALFGVANRPDTFSALQDILIGAIESLEPEASQPSQPGAWEIYEPLFYRYVQQLTQRQVARQLGMSVRHLRRKEHAALEVLAGRLWEQYDLEAKRLEGGELSAPHAVDSPTVNEELAWLKEVSPESPADLNCMLPDILELARPLAARHEVSLDISVADGLPSLAVHSVALSQALLNLLSVAIHHSSGSQVSLSAMAIPLQVEIEVRGVRSFPHATLDDDVASLDMAYRLADVCGGSLRVSGMGEGTFVATLTLPALEQLPVLVVDDNADTLQLLKRYVAGTRYRLITTRNPEQVLGLVEAFSPQIIVLDVMMPRVDGWKLLSQLRQHLLTEHTPIVLCTILAQEEMALTLGASGFVRKPVTRQAFLAALDRQVERMETISR